MKPILASVATSRLRKWAWLFLAFPLSGCQMVTSLYDSFFSKSANNNGGTTTQASTYSGINGSVSTFAGTGSAALTNAATGSSAAFNAPIDVCSDGTNLWVLDESNNTVRKIVIASTAVSTPWGNPIAAINAKQPNAICTDGTNLYIANNLDDTIVKIVIASGTTSVFAGASGTSGTADGVGGAARFNQPQGICYDSTNNLLWVADSTNNRIRKIDLSTAAVTTWAGSGSVSTSGSTATFLNDPRGICTDGTNVYVADFYNQTVDKVSVSTGATTVFAGQTGNTGYSQTDNSMGTSALIAAPEGICTDSTNLFFTDNGQTIRKINLSTSAVATVAGAGTTGFINGLGANARFSGASQLCFSTNALYVADQSNNVIREVQ